MTAICSHEDRWQDGVRWVCSDCGHSELIDPNYDYEDDDRD